MRSNPFIQKGLSEQVYEGEAMSVKGACQKTLALIGVTIVTGVAGYLWALSMAVNAGNINASNVLTGASSIIGLITILVMAFNPRLAKGLGLLYAATEGIFIGSLSFRVSIYFDGMIVKALLLTLLAVIFTLLLYKENPDLAGKIRNGVIIMTVSILAISLLGLVFNLLGMPYVFFEGGLIGIGFSILVTGVAIANLMLDYDNILYGARAGLPKYMEWFFGVGILVTVVWIYVEILNLLMKLASRQE